MNMLEAYSVMLIFDTVSSTHLWFEAVYPEGHVRVTQALLRQYWFELQLAFVVLVVEDC
jgi:hypothetical protein